MKNYTPLEQAILDHLLKLKSASRKDLTKIYYEKRLFMREKPPRYGEVVISIVMRSLIKKVIINEEIFTIERNEKTNRGKGGGRGIISPIYKIVYN